MSELALKRLVGALAVVVMLWLGAMLITDGSGSISASGEITGFFDGVDSASVDAVRIGDGGDAVELTRTGMAWTVNGYPADRAAVSRLMAALSDASIGDLGATNPQNHDRMGVSADSATALSIDTGQGSRTILIGDAGPRFGTSWARMPGEDAVYLLEGDVRAQIDRDVDAWRNRVMVAVDSADVARIEVDRDDVSWAVVRSDSAWTLDGEGAENGDGAAAPVAIEGILSELTNLVATGFVAESDSIAALPRASMTRALSSTGEVLAEITIGSGSGDRWARTASDDDLYRVSSFRADRVAPALASVRNGGQ